MTLALGRGDYMDDNELTEYILPSVKKMLGISYDYDAFDSDIIMHTNSVLAILTQMGLGPNGGFAISGNDEKWTDFIPNVTKFNFVKSYVFLKVRLLFDPPQSGTANEAANRMISEMEWRLYTESEWGGSED